MTNKYIDFNTYFYLQFSIHECLAFHNQQIIQCL